MFTKLLLFGGLLAFAKASDGDFLGTFETISHGVNGEVYAEDDQTILIKSFVYDGDSDDAYFALSKTEDMAEPLEFLPDELGFKEALGTYMNEDIRLRLPAGATISDYKSMSIYCKTCKDSYGSVVFGKYPKPIVRSVVPLSRFSGKLLHAISGDLFAVDDATLLLKNFNYDGMSEDGQFVLYKDVNRINETMELITDEEGTTNPMVQYRDYDLVLALKAGTKLSHYRGLAIYCAKYNVLFGVAEFPSKLPKLPRATRRTIRPVTLGQFEMGTSHNVTGFLHRINEKTLLITRLTYDGMSPDGQFVLTTDPEVIADVEVLGDERGNTGPLRKYEGRDVFVNLPQGKKISDYKGFALYCAKYNLDFAHVFFPTGKPIARPILSAKVNMALTKKLGTLSSLMHDVSGEVYALDDRTIFLKNFTYDGTSADGKFTLFKTDKIEEPSEALNDEWDSDDALLEYQGKDLTVRLNPDTKLSDYKSFAIYCKDYKLNFGSVVFGEETKALTKGKDQLVEAGSLW